MLFFIFFTDNLNNIVQITPEKCLYLNYFFKKLLSCVISFYQFIKDFSVFNKNYSIWGSFYFLE